MSSEHEVLEVEPNDDFKNPQKIEALPVTISGRLEKLNEVDHEGGVQVEVALSAEVTDPSAFSVYIGNQLRGALLVPQTPLDKVATEIVAHTPVAE